MYRKHYLVIDNIPFFTKLGCGAFTVVALSLLLRGIGRNNNSIYDRFSKALALAREPKANEDVINAIRQFDFDFECFPISYTASNQVEDKKSQARSTKYSSAPCRLLGYLAIHTFGIKMIYPGSVRLLQKYLHPMLLSGRSKLIEEYNGKRYKLETVDRNQIDTIFIDNRGLSPNGSTLVLCSEGNAGFYEIGIIGTPLELKYSILGWNHPGFSGSTGSPYPDQDKNAVEAVFEFATKFLNFSESNIVLHGWSIGAFPTLTLASRHDGVQGVILDATFDDILPLALPRMPEILSGVVKIAIREFVNLHNAELIKQYPGPVLLVRRSEDEIICSEDGVLASNRGNFLLLSLLKFRFPNLFKEAQQNYALKVLSSPLDRTPLESASEIFSQKLLESYLQAHDKSYPVYIGDDLDDDAKNQLVLYLIKKHFFDFKSTHCTPLPVEYFTPDILFNIEKI